MTRIHKSFKRQKKGMQKWHPSPFYHTGISTARIGRTVSGLLNFLRYSDFFNFFSYCILQKRYQQCRLQIRIISDALFCYLYISVKTLKTRQVFFIFAMVFLICSWQDCAFLIKHISCRAFSCIAIAGSWRDLECVQLADRPAFFLCLSVR